MSDFDEGLAAGLTIGKKKWGNGGGTETEVEWKYPDDWLPLPDAGEGECMLLIRPSADRKKIGIILRVFYYNYLTDHPEYHANINWGDGITEMIDNIQLSKSINTEWIHEYSNEVIGQYLLIRIKTMYDYIQNSDGTTNRIETSVCGFINSTAGYIWNILAASVGTALETSETSRSFNPVYIRFQMTDFNELSVDSLHNDFSDKPYSGYYRNTFLTFTGELTKRIDFTGQPKIWGCGYGGSRLQSLKVITGVDSVTALHSNFKYVFNSSLTLEKISFPNVAELGDNTWNYMYSVREVYLPKCTKIGAGSLCNNFCLQKLTVAKGCEIDPTALQNNYQYVEITEI